MSAPISYCLIVKACHDENAYQRLFEKMKYNEKCGHWSQFPCQCEIKCEATEEEINKLNERLSKDLLANSVIDNAVGSDPKDSRFEF